MLGRPRLLLGDRRAALVTARRPVAVDRDGVGEGFGARGHGGNLHSPHVARDPRRHGVHGPAGARRGPAGRASGAARRAAPRGALEALARPDEEVRVADARDAASLARGLRRDAIVVASLAGPFLELGLGPVQAAVAAGAHYLDTTGEQAVRQARPRSEVQAETVVLPAFGFDYVPGRPRCAPCGGEGRGPARRGRGRLFGQGRRDEPGDAANDRPRDGSEAGGLAGRPAGPVLVRRDDAHCPLPVRRADGRRVGRNRADHGATAHGRPERALVHPRVRQSRRRPAVWAGSRRPFVRAASRFGPSGPSEASRRKSRFTVVAEARGPGGTGRAVVEGTDVYGLTALLIVRGAEALLAGEARGTGVLAPAEAFDAARSPAGSSRTCGSRSDVVRSGAYGAVQCNGSER